MPKRSRLSRSSGSAKRARMKKEWDGDSSLRDEYIRYAKQDWVSSRLNENKPITKPTKKQLEDNAFEDWVATVELSESGG